MGGGAHEAASHGIIDVLRCLAAYGRTGKVLITVVGVGIAAAGGEAALQVVGVVLPGGGGYLVHVVYGVGGGGRGYAVEGFHGGAVTGGIEGVGLAVEGVEIAGVAGMLLGHLADFVVREQLLEGRESAVALVSDARAHAGGIELVALAVEQVNC